MRSVPWESENILQANKYNLYELSFRAINKRSTNYSHLIFNLPSFLRCLWASRQR